MTLEDPVEYRINNMNHLRCARAGHGS